MKNPLSGFNPVADSLAVAGVCSCNGNGRWMAFSPPAMMVTKRILYGIAAGIAVVGGDNSIQRHFGFLLRFGNDMVAGAHSCNGKSATGYLSR